MLPLIRPSARVAVLALLAGGLLVAWATPARAHAQLDGGSVVDGEVLETAPDELFLDFDEAVVATRGGLRVYDPAGERVDVGGAVQPEDAPDRVRVELADELDEGTYAVTYRVTSADGHPVQGALVFSVGSESAGAEALVARVFSSDADRPWAVAAAAARGVMYLGTLLAAGAVLVLWWLRRDTRGGPTDGGGVTDVEVAAVVPWLTWAVRASVGATAVGLVTHTVLIAGDGLASVTDESNVAATLGSFVGISALLRITGALVLVMAVRRRGPASPVAIVGGGLMLVSLLSEGHTLTTGPTGVVWVGATVHIAAAALWLGGLVILAVVLRSRRRADDPVGAGRLVARTSTMLTAAVVAVVLAGVALSWAEVRATRALFGEPYGWALLTKLALVLPLVAIGAYNNRRLVPVLTARRARGRGATRPVVAGGSREVTDRARARDTAWVHLRRTVRLELGLVAAVLAVTGVLVALQPAAQAAGITGAYSETVALEGIGQMTFTVDPNRAGRNEMHLYLLGPTGRPVDAPAEEAGRDVALRLSHPALDIGPLVREPLEAGPGHYVLAGPELSVAGRWLITVEVPLGPFDVASTTIDVVVNE